MTTAKTMVQRNSPHRPKPTGHSLNVEDQCDHSSRTLPLETEWITEKLIARTQDVWRQQLKRTVDREEAIEILLNVQRIALVLYQNTTEDN